MAVRKAIKVPAQEPAIRRSKAGYEFCLNEPIWKLDNSQNINWENIREDIDPIVVNGFLLATARMAEEVSARHTANCWLYMKQYLLGSSHYRNGLISENHIVKLRSSLDAENEYKLGTIRGFLRNWIDWGYPGVEKGLEKLLDKLVLRGNVKGKAVLHHCPYSGPFTITEQQSLLNWAANAFQTRSITLEQFAWFYLVYASARRPVQLRALRFCDLKVKKECGRNKFEIDIPRAKQRGGGFRQEMRFLTVSEDLFMVLLNFAEQMQKQALKRLPGLTKEDLNDFPVFPSFDALSTVRTIEQYRERLSSQPDYFHMRSDQARKLSRDISNACEAISERTNDFIHFTPTRCRRTRATNLVRHGITGVQLAYLMDQSDTQQVKIYTEYTTELSLRIFKKMDEAMTFLATKFEGRLIESEREAKRAGDINSRVRKQGGQHVGNCGGAPACQSGIKSCLICVQFQPLLHAPWDELMVELMEELEDRKSQGASELVLQSYDLQLAHVRAIMTACDKKLREQV